MANNLRAVGYDAVQVDHLARLTPDPLAEFAVVRCPAVEMCGLTGRECLSDSGHPKLAIGWLRREGSEATQLRVAAAARRDEHVVRIFSAIAPLFMHVDREAAERLARGIDALRSTIWGPRRSGVAWEGDRAASTSEALD